MAIWIKHPEEKILVGRDWTLDLDGATIDGDPPAPETPPGSTLALEFVETEGNVTKYWLSGGAARWRGKIGISIQTSEGETLADRITVEVRV